MKLLTLLKMPKLLATKIEFGDIGSWTWIVRKLLIKHPFEDDNSVIDPIGLRNELLMRIGHEYVTRRPIVDFRELDEMIELSKEFGFEIARFDIPEMITGQGDYQSGKVKKQTINIERKEDDFIPSLFNDGHIYKQLQAMTENKNVKASYLFLNKSLEDIKFEMQNKEKPIPLSVLYTYIAELILIGYPPVFIPNREDFFHITDRLFSKYYETPDRVKPIKKINTIININKDKVITMEGISDTLGERLIDHFGTVKDVVNAEPKELQKVKGIGPKLALELYDKFN